MKVDDPVPRILTRKEKENVIKYGSCFVEIFCYIGKSVFKKNVLHCF